MSGRPRFLILSLLFSLSLKGSVREDSILKSLKGPMQDTLRVQGYIGLAEEHYLNNPEIAIKDCENALQLSRKINYQAGIINASGWLAYLFEQQGQISKALEYYQVSLELASQNKSLKDESTILNNIAAIYKDQGRIEESLKLHSRSLQLKKQLGDKDGMASSYNNIGLIYASQGKIQEALNCYATALNLEEEIRNMDGISTALVNIGSIYRAQQDYDKALEHFNQALQINVKAKNPYSEAYSLNSIGTIYNEWGKLDSALIFFRKAYALRQSIQDEQGLAYSSRNIGTILLQTGARDSAKWYFEKSLEGFKNIGDKWGMATVTNKLGAYYLAENKITEAEKILLQSLQLAKELGYPAEIRDAADNLQRVYREKKDWRKALLMKDLFTEMRDSVLNDHNRKAALQAQFRYEYEKKTALLRAEQQKKEAVANAEIKKQRQLRNATLAGFGIVAAFSLVVYRQRNRIAKEKQRSEDLLLNILPAETAEELKKSGSAQARNFDQVTVMFTDFKDFTLISEKLSAGDLVAEIHHCFKAFDTIIGKYSIEKIKTIGDAYMCAGGLPVQTKTNAEDIVAAAIEIITYMETYKSRRLKEHKLPFEIRIGIHSGPVVAGIVGVKKFAYDIWGDTVNIAARMESSGEAGKINISGATYELIKEKYPCTYRGKITAKNKGAIDMYFLDHH